MKKFKKRLMVLPLAVGSLFATTACSSNIKFNQENLDSVMSEAQQYLEGQNNYSTEYARNVLLDYLGKGLDKFDDTYVNEKYTTEYKSYDFMGNVVYSYSEVIKNCKKDNKVLAYIDLMGLQQGYIVSEKVPTNSDYEYEIKFYDVQAKKFASRLVNIEEDGDFSGNAVNSLLDDELLEMSIRRISTNPLHYYSYIFAFVNSESSLNIVMDTIDQNNVSFTLFLDGGISKIGFSNGFMTSFEQSSIYQTDSEGEPKVNPTRTVVKNSFEYDIQEFEIEAINSYTQVN